MENSPSASRVAIPLARFLLTNHCPPQWKRLDLYLFRDSHNVFYVGQSYCAYSRVWEHLMSGFKGHSIMGHFIWCNWPAAMHFTVELMDSQDAEFACVNHELDAAERLLIHRYAPVFNISLNEEPRPVPEGYRPVNGPLTCPRSWSRIIHEAERMAKAQEEREWKKHLQEN